MPHVYAHTHPHSHDDTVSISHIPGGIVYRETVCKCQRSEYAFSMQFSDQMFFQWFFGVNTLHTTVTRAFQIEYISTCFKDACNHFLNLPNNIKNQVKICVRRNTYHCSYFHFSIAAIVASTVTSSHHTYVMISSNMLSPLNTFHSGLIPLNLLLHVKLFATQSDDKKWNAIK